MTLKALHVGCGTSPLPAALFPGEWQEIRLDIDPAVKPDLVASITEIPLEANSVHGVYSSHNVEHLHAHDVPRALAEFHRVLCDKGICWVGVPDMGRAAEWIAQGGGEAVAYVAGCGPITPMDIVFGHRGMSADNPFMAHRTGFTLAGLTAAMERAGFSVRHSEVIGWDLWAMGVKDADRA